MIPIAKPLIGEEEKNAVASVLSSGTIAQGPKVKDFEEAFAKYIGAKRAVAASNGTTALHLALIASGVGPGDEVITTPFSFIATANSILYCGAKPVFADVNENSFNLDPEKVREKITKKTKAIMPVHLYGNPCEMREFQKIAHDNSLALVEDACQAHGAEYSGKKAGSFGAGCFSFYPTKNMTTSEGGMIATNDDAVADKCVMLRQHGSTKRYFHDELGYNYRMTDIAAAIGIEQLKKLESFNSARIATAAYYDSQFKGVRGIETPFVEKGCRHVFHQYTLRVTPDAKVSRDEFAEKLGALGVGTGIYYPLPIHLQPLYKKLGYEDCLPVSEKLAKEAISIPVHPAVSTKERETVARAVLKALE